MPKYKLSDAQLTALKASKSLFANLQATKVDGSVVTGGFETETKVFLDETQVTKTSDAPYWTPIILDSTTSATTTAVSVDIPWFDGAQTITIENTDATNFVNVYFNVATSTPLKLPKASKYTLDLDARFVKTLYLKGDTAACSVRVLVEAVAPKMK